MAEKKLSIQTLKKKVRFYIKMEKRYILFRHLLMNEKELEVQIYLFQNMIANQKNGVDQKIWATL